MHPYSKMISAYVRIWFLASVVNAVLSSFILTISTSAFEGAEIFGALILIFILSLFYAIVPVLSAMILAAIIISFKTRLSLFWIILLVNSFASVATAVWFKIMIGSIDSKMTLLCTSIIISAMLPVFICRKYLREIVINEE